MNSNHKSAFWQEQKIYNNHAQNAGQTPPPSRGKIAGCGEVGTLFYEIFHNHLQGDMGCWNGLLLGVFLEIGNLIKILSRHIFYGAVLKRSLKGIRMGVEILR